MVHLWLMIYNTVSFVWRVIKTKIKELNLSIFHLQVACLSIVENSCMLQIIITMYSWWLWKLRKNSISREADSNRIINYFWVTPFHPYRYLDYFEKYCRERKSILEKLDWRIWKIRLAVLAIMLLRCFSFIIWLKYFS